jgi:beta-phosphoglucomutase-like phosphatase (HAD superfamily)
MPKLTLPELDDFYADLVKDPNLLRVVALSRGVQPARGRCSAGSQPRRDREFLPGPTFCLDDYLSVFLSSCYLGIRKPDEETYRLALDITQRHPEECLFIDDRAVNMECADRVGIPIIRFHDPAQLKDDLELRGVTV